MESRPSPPMVSRAASSPPPRGDHQPDRARPRKGRGGGPDGLAPGDVHRRQLGFTSPSSITPSDVPACTHPPSESCCTPAETTRLFNTPWPPRQRPIAADGSHLRPRRSRRAEPAPVRRTRNHRRWPVTGRGDAAVADEDAGSKTGLPSTRRDGQHAFGDPLACSRSGASRRLSSLRTATENPPRRTNGLTERRLSVHEVGCAAVVSVSG